ncbi:MFP1 attachment factor 1-like [Lycium barbarum]|uniref:MFP1 attachment factor 1-like n=1 Tax=Lycium barbarum TaxID=112863 RepID=UPI00293F4869|nr:MFP1 attachment factor 1-like [Lycium barbarum]
MSKTEPTNLSFSIWPPTQRTRDAVVQCLIETQSSHPILSKRYGTVPLEKATDTARLIEKEAFNYAGSSSSPDNEDIKILRVYSKEISKHLLDTVKDRSATTASTRTENRPSEPLADALEQTSSAPHAEEISSVGTES